MNWTELVLLVFVAVALGVAVAAHVRVSNEKELWRNRANGLGGDLLNLERKVWKLDDIAPLAVKTEFGPYQPRAASMEELSQVARAAGLVFVNGSESRWEKKGVSK